MSRPNQRILFTICWLGQEQSPSLDYRLEGANDEPVCRQAAQYELLVARLPLFGLQLFL